MAPLAAGCACCDSLEELVQLCKTASNAKGDLLLVELNGTADPLVLLETFTLMEKRLAFFPRYQVCVIDARYWGKRDEFEILERRQLETAGFWYISHKVRSLLVIFSSAASTLALISVIDYMYICTCM